VQLYFNLQHLFLALTTWSGMLQIIRDMLVEIHSVWKVVTLFLTHCLFPTFQFPGVCWLQPKVVSDTEEMELARHLERLEEQNREISGDEASDSSGPEDDGDGEAGAGRGESNHRAAKTSAADGDVEMKDNDDAVDDDIDIIDDDV